MDEKQSNGESPSIIAESALSEEQRTALDNLLDELLSFAAIPDQSYLSAIIVVPDGKVSETVNRLIGGSGYVPGSYVATATALQVERDGVLICYVILSAGDLASLTKDRYHPFSLVSSLLEELLHVRIYITGWQQRGSLIPQGLSGCEIDIHKLCSMIHDEYMVGRIKASILARRKLVELEDSPQLVEVPVFYGASVADHLNQADGAIASTLRAVAGTHTLSIGDAWNQTLQIIYRLIFEPLAREAGFRAGNTPINEAPPNDPAQSRYYQDKVNVYWQHAVEQLERSFRTNLIEMDEAISALTGIVREFLASVGVTYSTNATGQCRVDFVY